MKILKVIEKRILDVSSLILLLFWIITGALPEFVGFYLIATMIIRDVVRVVIYIREKK